MRGRLSAAPSRPRSRALDAPGQALRMPAFRDRLSDTELEAVLAYIKTWWTEEQRRFQDEVTRRRC